MIEISELVKDYSSRKSRRLGKNLIQLALVEGDERYIFLYDDNFRAECLRTLGRYASNDDLSFTWYDAAILSQKIRQETKKVRGLDKVRGDRFSSGCFNDDIDLEDQF